MQENAYNFLTAPVEVSDMRLSRTVEFAKKINRKPIKKTGKQKRKSSKTKNEVSSNVLKLLR